MLLSDISQDLVVYQWRIFYRFNQTGGEPPSWGYQPIIWPNFFLKKIERNWIRMGGRVSAPHVASANDNVVNIVVYV